MGCFLEKEELFCEFFQYGIRMYVTNQVRKQLYQNSTDQRFPVPVPPPRSASTRRHLNLFGGKQATDGKTGC